MKQRRASLAAVGAAAWFVLAVSASGGAVAATPYADIASAGPLTHIYLGNELSCQVAYLGDTDYEFYPSAAAPGDCGTLVALEGSVYAPNFQQHPDTATDPLTTYTPFAPVSQSSVSGSGTLASPLRVVTTVTAPGTGLQLEQTDTYVAGDEAYRTDTKVTNTGNSSRQGVLFRAFDDYLGGNDSCFGFTETYGARKAVGCSVNANNSPPGRFEEAIPLTGGNSFYLADAADVWDWIGTQKTDFPNTCTCSTFQDQGFGVSWPFRLPPGASATFSNVMVFSPTGRSALVADLTADHSVSKPQGQNGYTLRVSNPNPSPVTLDAVTDTLPSGFAYASGSTSGLTSADPTVSGDVLTWSGSFVVPGRGSVSLHFGVNVPATEGDYFDAAGAHAAGYTVLPTEAATRVTVATAPPPPQVGRTANVTPVSGVVFVRLRGTNVFVELTAARQIPVGSELDTTYGRVSLTAASGHGKTQTADFYDGRFLVQQRRSSRPVLTAALSEPLSCSKAPARKKPPKRRRLWGSGKGRFRTKGKVASATVRGTEWLTQDTCDGTLVQVRRGVVDVFDFVRHKHVFVRAGHRYFVRAHR